MSDEPEKPGWRWRKAALWGAVIAHPVVLLIVILYGAVIGIKPFMPDGAKAVRGWDGIGNGVGDLLVIYILTFGIFPLILSVVGAIVGVAISWMKHVKDNP